MSCSLRSADAGALCYASFDASINSTGKLRVEKAVLAVPGDHFGGWITTCVSASGISEDELVEGLRQVRGRSTRCADSDRQLTR